MKRIHELSTKTQKLHICHQLLDAYNDLEPAGGSLHVVIDDGNLEDHFVESCIEYARKNNDHYGIIIGELLLEFTVEERDMLTSRWWVVEEVVRDGKNFK